MVVYLLVECYDNGCDTWDTVIAAFKDETEAELVAIQKNEDHYESYSYYVKSMEVQ